MARVLAIIAFSIALTGCGGGTDAEGYKDGRGLRNEDGSARDLSSMTEDEKRRRGAEDVQILFLETTWEGTEVKDQNEHCVNWTDQDYRDYYRETFLDTVHGEYPDWDAALTVDFFDTVCADI